MLAMHCDQKRKDPFRRLALVCDPARRSSADENVSWNVSHLYIWIHRHWAKHKLSYNCDAT